MLKLVPKHISHLGTHLHFKNRHYSRTVALIRKVRDGCDHVILSFVFSEVGNIHCEGGGIFSVV